MYFYSSLTSYVQNESNNNDNYKNKKSRYQRIDFGNPVHKTLSLKFFFNIHYDM